MTPRARAAAGGPAAAGRGGERGASGEVAAGEGPGDYAPLAVHYAGVSRYKGGDKDALPATGRTLRERYPGSSWATRSSVWLPAGPEGTAAR